MCIDSDGRMVTGGTASLCLDPIAATVQTRWRLRFRILKCLIDVPQQVVEILGADGEADLFRLDHCQPLFCLSQLSMRHLGGMHHQRF